jgi:DNA polymerase III delta' subunit
MCPGPGAVSGRQEVFALSFERIKDQESAIRLIRRAIESDRVPNAYLFIGPDGVGKELAARNIAKALNCAEQGCEPCDRCLACTEIDRGMHPDVSLITPMKLSRQITTDRIAGVIESASLKPFEGRRRVFIFREADRINVASANKFLKTLEEPPGDSVFILLTELPDALLPTIRSRCHQIRFRTLSPETVRDILVQEQGIEPELARTLASLSDGQMSKAIALATSDLREKSRGIIEQLSSRGDPVGLAEQFVVELRERRKAVRATIQAEAAGKDGHKIQPDSSDETKAAYAESVLRNELYMLLRLMGAWYRDVLVCAQTHDSDLVLNTDSIEEIETAAKDCEHWNMVGKLDSIERTKYLLERNINEERAFRTLFMTLADRTAARSFGFVVQERPI